MRIEFGDERLALICTDEAHKLGLPIAVIKAARNRLIQLEALTDERDLMNLRGLRYKKLGGDLDGQRQVRVNDQYRIRFTLDDTQKPHIITVTFIGDPH
jgi:proteic killer suppression protein